MGSTRGTEDSTGSGRSVRAHFSNHRWLVGGALGATLLLAAACGSSAASPTSTTAQSAPASAVSTVAAVHSGSLGTILVDQSGQTLYRFAPDGTGKTTCTGACATAWPPLTVPTAATHLAGKGGVPTDKLGTITRPGGTLQVTFEGMPLYRFAADTKAGQTKGQGVEGTWFVVSPTAAPPTTTAPTMAVQPAATTVPAPVTTVPPNPASAAVTPATAHVPTTTPAPPPTAAPTTTPTTAATAAPSGAGF
jgi:predicted lipoprotein with Yx(FWY)xxD motif